MGQPQAAKFNIDRMRPHPPEGDHMPRQPAGRRKETLASGEAKHNGSTLNERHDDLTPFGTLAGPSRAEADLDPALDFEPLLEPAGSALAMAESPEGEHLYREIKTMEYESLQHPDPEDVLAQAPLTDDEPVEVP